MLLFQAVAAWILAVTSVLSAHAQERAVVRIENPLPTARTGEVVAVPWEELTARIGGLSAEQVRARVLLSAVSGTAGGATVPTQVMDTDEDGQPDELLLLASFRPEEERTFVVEAAAPAQAPEQRAHVAHNERRDDIAWENQRVAFRTYGQGLRALEDLVSSGIDVWLKRGAPKLVIDAWYADGHYHTDTGEGADFFSVGPTLGAGGTALWRGGELHRAPNFSDYRIVADGPLRAVVELEYGPWDASGLQVTEHKRLTIDAGDYAFRSESTFRIEDTEGASPDSLMFATGLVERPEAVASMQRGGQSWAWLSLWGPVETGSGGHGDLGTAVLLPQAQWRGTRVAESHYLALGPVALGAPVTHYVAFGWTATDAFEGGIQNWWTYLDAFARELQEPLRVEVKAVESTSR